MNSEWLRDFYAAVDRHPWLILFAAGIFEILWALSLKLSAGYTKLWPTLATIPLALLSTILLAMAMRTVPMGTAYAIWVGFGAVGTVAIGIFWFHESADVIRIFCVALIVAGIIGLKFAHKAAS